MHRIALGLLFLVAASGCGGSRTYPVTGKVVYKDGSDISPLTGGLVVFEPLEAGAKDSARGEIQADGTFRLGTFKDADGAPAGRYRGLVTPPTPPPTDEKRPVRQVLHPRYLSPATSPLEFTVDRDNTTFTLTVERP
jgi:hypothetical protein